MSDKKYHITIRTPLGSEPCLLSFTGSECSVVMNKGSATSSLLTMQDSAFNCLFETDISFPCQVQIHGEIVDSSINGKIYIGDYLEVKFDGEETDGKPIPGIC